VTVLWGADSWGWNPNCTLCLLWASVGHHICGPPRGRSQPTGRKKPASQNWTEMLLQAPEVLLTPPTYELYRLPPWTFRLVLRLLSIYVVRIISSVYLRFRPEIAL
jgi:hypothetical protein